MIDDVELKIPPELLQGLYDAQQQMVPADLREKGWVYRDVPRMSLEYWEQFINALGEDYQCLIMSKGDNWARGQFFLSPQAMDNIAALAKSLKPC